MLSALALLLATIAVSLPADLSSGARTASTLRPHTPSAVIACAAISKTDVEAAVGHSLAAGVPEQNKFESTCTYSSGDVAVTISLRSLTQPLDLTREIQNLKAAFPGSKLRTLKGLGDRAYALEIPGAGVQLHVLTGDREYLLVSVLGIRIERSGAAALRIARQTLRSNAVTTR